MATWFTYEYCTDIAATRDFYVRLIGLTQIWDEENNVAFTHDCVQLSFTRIDQVERPEGWAFQPGWANGQLPDAPLTVTARSISLALAPDEFEASVERLRQAGVRSLRPEPFWVGYWSFVVADPDGMTVELTDATSPGPTEV